MCIYSEQYNKAIAKGNVEDINAFMDTYCKQDSKEHCPQICGGCNYLGYLEDRIVELEGMLYNYEQLIGGMEE